MHKFFIATDSRGTIGPTTKWEIKESWTKIFYDTHPDWEIVMRRSGVEIPTYTLFDTDPFLLSYPDQNFDVAFLQCGYQESIEYYTPDIFQQLFPEHYNPSALSKERTTSNRAVFTYRDIKKEKDMFNILKQKCKHVVFITMHSLINFRTQESTATYIQNASEMNARFKSLATDFISLPTDSDWPQTHCLEDGIHFNTKGRDYILTKIEKWTHAHSIRHQKIT